MAATLVTEERAVEVVDLKALRRHVDDTIRQLQTARETAEIRNAITRLQSFSDFICDPKNGACGPEMIFPLTPQ